MARWLFNVMTMVWLRWRGGTTVRSRCCIDAIVWCSDGTIALMQGMSMMQWKWIDVLFHHHYRTIALLTNLHFCCLKKMAARLLCSLQLLWFTLHWSSMLVFNGFHVCMGFIVPLENFSFILRRHHYWKRAENFDLCSTLMAIMQWGFLAWHINCDTGHPI